VTIVTKIKKAWQTIPMIMSKINYAHTFKYVFTSAVIFCLIFLGLYGKTYFEVFSWRVEQALGLNETLAVESDQEILKSNNALLQINKIDPQKNINLADLHLILAPPDNRVILPKVYKNFPIVEIDDGALRELKADDLQDALLKGLESGIVHYPLTAKPGSAGNVVLTGHSSYYSWAEGDFKDAFAVMHNMEIGDKIIVYYGQKKYVYQIFEKKIVEPEDIGVLEQLNDKHWLTTITCTPIGSNKKRLVDVAKQIYPPVE